MTPLDQASRYIAKSFMNDARLKRGTTLKDGLVLWGYNKQCVGGMYWVTREKYDTLLFGESKSHKRNKTKYVNKARERSKNYYLNNKEKCNERAKAWRSKNATHRKTYALEYSKRNRIRIADRMRSWVKKNSEKIKKWRGGRVELIRLQRRMSARNVRATNPSQKIAYNVRGRIRQLLIGKEKSDPSLKLLGCTADQFRSHLESKFKPGMDWGNYGLKGWHIDHIKPCSSFDLTDPNQQKECFHYSNCQPLWYWENLSKGNRHVG